MIQDGLTNDEERRLDAYRAAYPGEDRIFSIAQDITTGHKMLSGDKKLQCIHRNCGLMWVQSQNRWLTPLELLCLQGFPVHPRLHGGICRLGRAQKQLCSFNVCRVGCHRNRISQQVGNSMSVNMVGSVILWALCCVREKDALHLSFKLNADDLESESD